jgi:hypothetical protein
MRQSASATSRYVLLLHNILIRMPRHSIRAQLPALRHNPLMPRLPRPQALLSIIQRLPRRLRISVNRALLAGHNRRIVEQVDQLAGLRREQDLLLGALDDGGRVHVVGFFEFLARDVGELGFGDEGLGFGADELLLEGDEFGGFGFFVFELLNFVLDLFEGVLLACCFLVALTGLGKCRAFCLCVRLGCTELSVLRICFNTLRLSSRPCANKSSCSAISASNTPSLSLTSLKASSLVLSPHSLSWPAMEAPSLEACS